ncbi:MaoC/PaaZ C-terminal domain-containing protein [Sphingobium algorifonticola]|uniref:Dehydratase n=1 Tax=Sphingobium algorifonticola TaxID=2008318 RepID=A0A437JCB7_9SPHN|nr:MaoC/PaaZ C-terminal domain-containing protein [Sphingobium algorifonticola]RVT43535.1 dehydratase [Sphingobium algorifonticola]
MAHQRPPRKFEDLVIGESRLSGPRTLSQDDIVDFARRYDPQWFHVDPDAARASHFGELIASGIQVLAVWRILDHEMNSDIDFVCGVGWDEVRMKTAVRAGDTLRATSRIVDLIPSDSGKPRGTAITEYRLLNQHDAVVISFRSINLVYSRTAFASESGGDTLG